MCFIAGAFLAVNLMFMIPTPQMCSGMSDYEECQYMADIGCDMVAACFDGSDLEETKEQCYKRSMKKCDRTKGDNK